MSELKRFRVGVAVATAIVSMLAVPAVATGADLVGDLVDDVDRSINDLVGGGGGAGGGSPAASAQPASEPRAGTPPTYTPPAHGTAQHATGTGAIVDVTPSDQEPLPYEPGGGSEDVVVGSSYGEFDGNNYHGHVTILTLLGNELVPGADTNEGETSTGPFGDLNAMLADVCSGTSNLLCLSVLSVNSQTTDTGSTNSFDAATASVGVQDTTLVETGAVRTTGVISDDGTCRTATGTSQVADANVVGVTADVINASSQSSACNNGSSSQTNGGNVISLGGTGVPLPQAGCENGTPNTVFSVPLLVDVVCNADDSGGTQLSVPYGVREGLAVFPLTLLGNPAKAVTAAAESHALAPGGGDGGNGNGGNGGGDGGGDGGGGGDGDRDDDGVLNPDDECPNVPGPPANEGCPVIDTDGDGIPDDEDACPLVPGPASNDGCPLGGPGDDGPTGKGPKALAFTGSDVGLLAGIGLAVFATGLVLMAVADRRRRARSLAG